MRDGCPVNFDMDVASASFGQRARLANLRHNFVHELLSAKQQPDGHHEDEIDSLEMRLDGADGRKRID